MVKTRKNKKEMEDTNEQSYFMWSFDPRPRT